MDKFSIELNILIPINQLTVMLNAIIIINLN